MDVRKLVVVAFMVACDGNNKDGPTDKTDTGPDGPLVFEFNEVVAATAFDAAVAPAAVQAHQISSMLLASAALVVADEKVQDRLNTDGGGSFLRAAALQCWTRPDFPMFSFPIDYTGCGGYQIAGGVFVNDHASGPLLLEYQNFRIQERELGGVMALDTRGAYDSALYWQLYNTDADNPGEDNDVQIAATLDRSTFGVSYRGGTAIDFLQQEWATWGTLTIGVGDEAVTVVHGGRTPEEVAPNTPTGTDVLKSPLNWLACRCPQSGIQAQDMPLQFSAVRVDIDDLEIAPDIIDDPVLEIPVNYTLPGQGVLEHTGCGTYDVSFESAAVEIPVTTEQLIGAISFQCATLAINDERRCLALIGAANKLATGIKVSVSQEEAQQTAVSAVDTSFDTSWCRIY